MEIRSNSVSPVRNQGYSNDASYFNERYKSYSRVEGYIKHLNNIYHSQIVNYGTFDQAYESTSKFRTQTPPTDSIFKVSHFPRTSNHFPKPSQVPRSKSTSKPKKKSSVIQTTRASISISKEKINLEERCFKCFKFPCLCVKLSQVSIFQSLLAKKLIFLKKPKEKLHSKENSSKVHRKSLTRPDGTYSTLLQNEKITMKKDQISSKVLKISSFRSFRSNFKT
jgi:hypothetical protein